ncbi:hypothetical protein FOL47_004737 [Perkinsus chesapeaki]|uniref:Protein-serine/threonine kinase n=1 Tax=Perkinsus chesapeaki TaxID=330153 RepID=A0A7J6M0V2_PERCH|nr:hypothetical protein FOL47_004737 [Perkinsus chesapeaki]
MLNPTSFLHPTLEVAAGRATSAAAAASSIVGRSSISSDGHHQATGPYCVISEPCVLGLIAKEAQSKLQYAPCEGRTQDLAVVKQPLVPLGTYGLLLCRAPLPRYTLDTLLALQQFNKDERTAHLLHNLKRGVAICGYELQCYPFGFASQPSVKRVVDNYLQDFKDINRLQASMGDDIRWSPQVKAVMSGIFTRHKGTMIDIARGVLEFQETLRTQYDGRCTLLHTRESVPAITHIERKLDDFFSTRISCRLMISHILALNETEGKETGSAHKGDGPNPSSMHMLDEKPRIVGALTTNTMPVLVLQQAFEAAKYMCRRDYHGLAPDLVVNGMSLEEYLTVAPPQRSFAYVAQHLFYIFLEILKNAMRATVEKGLFDAGGDYDRCRETGPAHGACGVRRLLCVLVCDGFACLGAKEPPPCQGVWNGGVWLPPVVVTLPDLSSMWDFERTIKIADKGYGMKREILKRASSYFYSSATHKPDGTQELPDFDSRAPLAGFGFGLPISKVMARYFNGDLEVNSIPGAGTDVYIYL